MNASVRFLTAAGAALTFGSACFAGTVTWKSEGAKNYTDWTDGANFVGEVAPVAGDKVVLPASGAVVYLSDSDMNSFERASSLAQISPADSLSVVCKLVITVANAGTKLSLQSPISFDTTKSSDRRAEIYKLGAGALVLANKGSTYAYDSNVIIEEGTLLLPQDTTKNCYLADVAVSNAATFVTAASGSSSHPYTGCGNLYCDGVITNTDSAARYFRPSGTNTVVTERGLVAPNIQWYSSGCSTILSTNNTMKASICSFLNGTNRLMSIGLVGKPSSAGTGDIVGTFEQGGTILYLGEGETMDRFVNCGSPLQGATTLDAGPHGGLTVAPPSRLIWGKGVALFNLQGDGPKTNFFNGGATLRTFGSDPTNYYCNVTKRGLGTWRLSRYADNNDTRRDAIGTWSVENGTLQFEQLKESGVRDSFGLGDHGFEVGWYGLDPSTHRADYVFAFGCPEGTVPTFEYVGTEHVDCSTRPAILRGDARFVNSSTGDFRFKDISSGAEGTHQLILDGAASSVENVVSGLADGSVGAVGVTKRGDGTWILDGTNSFTGPVKVEGGKLVVRSASGKYSWFKFTLKEAVSTANEMQLFELGIYDADGNRINGGLKYAADYTSVKPGEVAYTEATSRFYECEKRGPDKLCDDALSTSYECDILKRPAGKDSGWAVFSRNDETTWATFVMRLDPSRAAATRYDMVSSSDYPTRRPSVWTVEGSVDGKVWDPLDSVTNDVPAPSGKYWWLLSIT